MKYRYAFALLLVAGGFTSVALAQEEFAFPPARVEVALAEIRDMAPVVDVSGTVVSLNDSRIASEVEGVLVWLADVGDAVDKGDVIARIDPRLMQVAYKRAEASVGRLEADFQYRERQLQRTEDLAAQSNASATLLDETRARRDQARHELNDARAVLEQAEGNLARSEIRAAFSGHITGRLASVGEYVTVGDDVVRLVDTHRLEIALPATIPQTRFVRPGMRVGVRSDGAESQHEVRTVVPVGDAVSRMVEIRLIAGDNNWLVGTAVTVRLPSDTPITTVAVPRDALVERGGRSLIYRVHDDGTAEQVIAEITTVIGLWVGIARGIDDGDRVIVRGAERLSPGQAVEVIGTAMSEQR